MKKFYALAILVMVALFVSGCVTENKAVGLSSGSDGFIVKAPGSFQTGSTSFVDIWLASNCFSYASAPALKDKERTQIVFTMSIRRSFFGSLFGVDSTSSTMTYIGNPGETAEETAKRLKAFKSVMDTGAMATASSTSDTASSTSSE